jgi:putative ABC transport system permease protein
MSNIGKDIVFAWRMLARSPVYTIAVAATLGLGIGANTATFSIVEAVLLKPLPFHEPGRLIAVSQKSSSGPQLGVSELDLGDYRARTHTFQDLAGFTAPGTKIAILTGNGNPLAISPSYITADYFGTLGVSPFAGRDFSTEESRRGRNQAAILSYSFWQSRFGGSLQILNRYITIDKRSLQVVGIMRPDVYPLEADVFLPFSQLHPDKPMPRNYHELMVIGRMRKGASLYDARKELVALSADLEQSYRSTNAGISANVTPLREEITGGVREPILFLLSSVALVLLIACANVANLILVRAASRQKEIAIRVALGAGREHITMQFAIECLMLSGLGTVIGVLLALAMMPIVQALGASRIPRLQHIGNDAGVLLFTLALATFTGLAFGLLPAARYASGNLNDRLRSGGRTNGADSGRLRSFLVGSEVAIALVVLIAAGLLLRSLNRLFDVKPGFRADHLLAANLALPSNHYNEARVNSFYRTLLPRIAAVPGVASVSTTTSLPLATVPPQMRFVVQGEPAPEPGRYPVAAIASVDATFFQTMGIPVLQGRVFQPEEVSNFDDERCIVNLTLARTYFGGRDPIGRIILTDIAAARPEPCRVVGVVGDTRVAGLDAPPRPILYFAAYAARQTIVVRTTTEPRALVHTIQQVVAQVDPEQPLSSIQSMDEVIARSLSRRSFVAVLLSLFSAVGLVLAAMGLYGVVSYSVAQRTQEIGLRMAVGAVPTNIFRLILWDGFRVACLGLVAGGITAVLCTHFMSGLLYEIGPGDPLSFAGACIILVTIAAFACLFPAHRATRVDPLVALRYH